jgi:CRP/FNR family cyclic AMP-dependent transcriptional regulator
MPRKHQIDQVLASVSLFSECPPSELLQVAKLCTLASVPGGRVLAREGDYGHEFFVVASGSAVVSINDVSVAVLGPGDFFGEIALLDGGTRTATVTAETDLAVEVISQRDFFTLLTNAPTVTRRILRHLGARIRATDAQLSA